MLYTWCDDYSKNFIDIHFIRRHDVYDVARKRAYIFLENHAHNEGHNEGLIEGLIEGVSLKAIMKVSLKVSFTVSLKVSLKVFY